MSEAMNGGSSLLADLGQEVHLWTAATDPGGAERADAWWRLLSKDERAAWRRFRVEHARRQHLAARALVRTTLSRYAPVAPEEWAFRRNRYGRPEISAPDAAPGLTFNLSHTEGVVACLVGLGLELGVDVEHDGAARDFLPLAERYFAPEEAASLRGSTGAELRRRFFSFWTLKESFVKARGTGLATPLRTFAFRLPAGDGDLGVLFDAALGESEAEWRFALYRCPPSHYLAVAARGARRVVARHVVPLDEGWAEARMRPLAATRAGARSR